MALKKTIRQRRPRANRGPGAPLPHPSWRLTPAYDPAVQVPIASAGEFWSRLGL